MKRSGLKTSLEVNLKFIGRASLEYTGKKTNKIIIEKTFKIV
jgi:hypothetical protein